MGPQRRKGTLWFLMVISSCISQSGFLPYNYEIPHNMGSVLVKETRIVALNIFGQEVRVGMQSIDPVCTALVFVVQMFLCQLVDAHSEVEYITLKNASKNWCYFKVSNSFLTELQEKNEKMFTLMSSSQNAISFVWACMHDHIHASCVLCCFVASLSMVLIPSVFLLHFHPLCFTFPSFLHMLYFQNRKCSIKRYAPHSSS